MITTRPSSARGHFDHGWLDTYHTFSFGDYHDPKHMAFGPLRVINEDFVAAGAGFPTHPHRDMEILTWVLEGALEHKDSSGGSGVIRPGDLQRMTAGRGVTHSEFNHSKAEPVHLLQIWIFPEERGLTPGYEQKRFDLKPGALTLLASRDGRDGSVTIRQDASVYGARLDAGQKATLELKPGRRAWVQMARGGATVNGQRLAQGDGAAIEDETRVVIEGGAGGGDGGQVEALVFDLP